MVDEKNLPAEGQSANEPEEEIEAEYTVPQSKYELIMMAAAEATRLNEEVRRKGIKLDRKVTLLALERVREGKVKAVVPARISLERSKPVPPPPDATQALFSNPPLVGSAEGEEKPAPDEKPEQE